MARLELKFLDPYGFFRKNKRMNPTYYDRESSVLPESQTLVPTDEIADFQDPAEIRETQHNPFQEEREKYQEAFKNADTAYVICGTGGLGDSILWARAALYLRETTRKNVVVQMQKAMIPAMAWHEGIIYTEQISTNELVDPKNFFVSLDPFSVITNPGSDTWLSGSTEHKAELVRQMPWLQNDPPDLERTLRSQLLSRIGQSYAVNTFYDHDAIFGQSSLRTVWDRYFPHKSENSHALFSYYNLRLQLLTGQKFNPEKYSGQMLELPPVGELPDQDIDLFVMPDAKEGVDPKNPEVSIKMVPEDTLVETLIQVVRSKDLQSVAILQGLTHPEFCQKVYERLRNELEIPVILVEGDVPRLVQKLIPRSKNIFVMDSLMAHVSHYASQGFAQYGRRIQVLEYYNGQYVYPDEYTIPGVPTYIMNNRLFQSNHEVLGSYPQIMIDGKANLLAYPQSRDLSQFLEQNLKNLETVEKLSPPKITGSEHA